MNALILFSHGSLLCGSGEALERHVSRLRHLGEWERVEAGYLNYSAPSFAESLAKCRRGGSRAITVLPYFLVPGYFVSKSLPQQIAAMQTEYPDLTFTVAEPIGYDERLADALIESALDPLGSDEWRKDLAAAARNCQANAQCPLYGTAICPRVPSAISMPPAVNPHGRKEILGNGASTALIVMAHGSPKPEANEAMLRIVSKPCAAAAFSIGWKQDLWNAMRRRSRRRSTLRLPPARSVSSPCPISCTPESMSPTICRACWKRLANGIHRSNSPSGRYLGDSAALTGVLADRARAASARPI